MASSHGHNTPICAVGLLPQGATCYMNSLLQQLYHIPDFRTGILGRSPPHDQSIE